MLSSRHGSGFDFYLAELALVLEVGSVLAHLVAGVVADAQAVAGGAGEKRDVVLPGDFLAIFQHAYGLVRLKKQSVAEGMEEYFAEARAEADAEPDATPEPPGDIYRVGGVIAVKSSDSRAVADALGLKNAVPANWTSANTIASSMFNYRTYVSAPVEGWVVVFGALPEPTPQQAGGELWQLLEQLSAKFGEAQYYDFSSVTMRNAWARALQGKMQRAYCVDANDAMLPWNYGAITDGERAAGVVYGESGRQGQLEGDLSNSPDVCLMEEAILFISTQWGSDIFKLAEKNLPASTGLFGKMETAEPQATASA